MATTIREFQPKHVHLEPVPFDKDHFSRWDNLFRKRCDRYGFLDVLNGNRGQAQAAPQPPGNEPAADAPADEQAAYLLLLNDYHDRMYDHDKFEFDLAQLTDLFFNSMGNEGMTELELRNADLDDVLKCYDVIRTACTSLLAQEKLTMTSAYVEIPWKATESIHDFRVRFGMLKTKLESCKVAIPQDLIVLNLLRIMKQRFPAYYPIYNLQPTITPDQLLDALENLQVQAEAAVDAKADRSSKTDVSKLSDKMVNAVLALHGHAPTAGQKKGGRAPKSTTTSASLAVSSDPAAGRAHQSKYVAGERHQGWCFCCQTRNPDHAGGYKNCPRFAEWVAAGSPRHRPPPAQSHSGMPALQSAPSYASTSVSTSASSPFTFGDLDKAAYTVYKDSGLPKLPYFLEEFMALDDSSKSVEYAPSIIPAATALPTALLVTESSTELQPSEPSAFTLVYASELAQPSHAVTERVLLDSACGVNVSPVRGLFTGYSAIEGSYNVRVANGQPAAIVGAGYVCGLLFYHVPDLKANLLSIGDLTAHGFVVEFGPFSATISYDGTAIESAKMESNMYFIDSTAMLSRPISTPLAVHNVQLAPP